MRIGNGHNWIISLSLSSEVFERGWYGGGSHIKETVSGAFGSPEFEERGCSLIPYAENIARWVCEQIICFAVEVRESEGTPKYL